MLFTDKVNSYLSAFPLLSRRRRRTSAQTGPPPPRCGTMDGQGFKPSRGFTSAYSLVSMTQQIGARKLSSETTTPRRSRRFAGVLRYGVAPCGQRRVLRPRARSNRARFGGIQADGTEATLQLADARWAPPDCIIDAHLFDVLLDQGPVSTRICRNPGQVTTPQCRAAKPGASDRQRVELFSAPCEGNGMNSRITTCSRRRAPLWRIAGSTKEAASAIAERKQLRPEEEENNAKKSRGEEEPVPRIAALGGGARGERGSRASRWRFGDLATPRWCAMRESAPAALHKHFHHASTHPSMIPTPRRMSAAVSGADSPTVGLHPARPPNRRLWHAVDPHFHDPASVSIVGALASARNGASLGFDGAAPAVAANVLVLQKILLVWNGR